MWIVFVIMLAQSAFTPQQEWAISEVDRISSMSRDECLAHSRGFSDPALTSIRTGEFLFLIGEAYSRLCGDEISIDDDVEPDLDADTVDPSVFWINGMLPGQSCEWECVCVQ